MVNEAIKSIADILHTQSSVVIVQCLAVDLKTTEKGLKSHPCEG